MIYRYIHTYDWSIGKVMSFFLEYLNIRVTCVLPTKIIKLLIPNLEIEKMF